MKTEVTMNQKNHVLTHCMIASMKFLNK